MGHPNAHNAVHQCMHFSHKHSSALTGIDTRALSPPLLAAVRRSSASGVPGSVAVQHGISGSNMPWPLPCSELASCAHMSIHT